MLSFAVDIASLAVVALVVLWGIWYLVRRFWSSAADTEAGRVMDKLVDITQDFSALAALRVIRWMDEIEKNPEALAAWSVLYEAIGGKDDQEPPDESERSEESETNEHAETVDWRPSQ